MRATTLEFRLRFAILGVIFFVCFFATSQQTHGHFGALWLQSTRWLSNLLHISNDASSLVLKVVVSVLVIAAAFLRTWAAAYLHSSVVHAGQVHADRVVAGGPYAYLRHPLYLANILLALALAPMNGPWEALAMVVLVTVFMLRLIGREEAELTASQGESYRRYRTAVPSLLPRWGRSGVVSAPAQAHWGQAFVGELWFWGFAAAVVLYAVTFRIDWFTRALIVSLGVYLIGIGLTPRRR